MTQPTVEFDDTFPPPQKSGTELLAEAINNLAGAVDNLAAEVQSHRVFGPTTGLDDALVELDLDEPEPSPRIECVNPDDLGAVADFWSDIRGPRR